MGQVKNLLDDREFAKNSDKDEEYLLDHRASQGDTPENCNHICTSECRRSGCNCACGEYHMTEEERKEQERDAEYEARAELDASKDDKYAGLNLQDDIYDHTQGEAD